jgi:flagellin-like hook-associated protein FlgL
MDERKEGIDQGISSVTTALEAIEAIDSLVQQMKGILISAKSASGNELVVAGTGSSLDIEFSTDTASILSIASLDVTTGTLGLAVTSLASLSVASTLATKVDDALSEIDLATETLRGTAQALGSNIALLQTRLDFTEKYVNALEGGSAKLTLADITEEGANLVALQTRQQLGFSALAFAGQSEQSVLSLFR